MFILSIGSDILFAVWQAIRGLIGVIVAALYGYIVDLYNVFMVISRVNILDDDYIKAIYNRVGMILGLFMLFKLSFSLIQSLIDPDKFTDKKNGFASIIYRSVIAIVLLGITPSIFKFARNFQNLIVGADDSSNNVLYRVVVADDIVYPVSSFGQRLATDLFFSFFREDDNRHYDEGLEVREIDGEPFLVVKNYATLKEDSYNGKISFDELVPYLSLKDAGQYVFKWDIILSVAVGVAVLWILVNYCISIATRVIQLAYLQLVAPVPILSYIGNPDGAFKKWINQCTKTYLDLFIRLIILYFIITLSGKALRFFEDANALSNYGIESDSMKFILVKVFLLLGLLMFGKRVPELIKELFPGDGKFDFGVKSPKNLFNSIPGSKLAKGAVGLGAGMALGGAGRVIGRLGHTAFNMKKAWSDNRGTGWKRLGSTLGAGAKGVGSAALGGVTGAFGGMKNYKGGLVSATKMGFGNVSNPLKEDINSIKEGHKNRKEARTKDKEENRILAYGESLYNRYVDPVTGVIDATKAYGHSEYRQSVKDLAAAKNAKGEADALLTAAETRYSEAVKSGNAARIEAAKKERADALKAVNTAKKRVTDATEKHDRNKLLYKDDARIESAIDKYKLHLSDQQTVDNHIDRRNSMFGSMSRRQFRERLNQNEYDANLDMVATYYEPNQQFTELREQFARNFIDANGQISPDDEAAFDNYISNLENAYRRNGYEKDSNGRWTLQNPTLTVHGNINHSNDSLFDTTVRNSGDPNTLFDNMRQDFNNAFNSGTIDEQFRQRFNDTWASLEAAYTRAGYVKDENGTWSISNQYGPPVPPEIEQIHREAQRTARIDQAVSNISDPNAYMDSLKQEIINLSSGEANETNLARKAEYHELMREMSAGFERAGYERVKDQNGKWVFVRRQSEQTPTPFNDNDSRQWQNGDDVGE